MTVRQFGFTLVLAMSAAPVVTAQTSFTQTATASATILTTGPRLNSGAIDTRFVNAENKANNSFASFGVLDFANPGAAALAGLTNITLQLTESDAAFTAPGTVTFSLAGTTTTITPTTNIKFDASTVDGVGTQLGTLYQLGQAAFTSTGSVNNKQVDNYTFSYANLDSTTQTYITNQIVAGGPLRVVITTDSTALSLQSATYAGITNSIANSVPTLTFSATPVPEPATLLIVGAAAGLVTRRRRKSAAV